MTNRLKRLELTWIGKEERPRLEPRILLEDEELSYAKRVSKEDIFDNRLIHGDNLLALKALEQEFAGKVKCVFIDPPYNTGSAFEQYDDGLRAFYLASPSCETASRSFTSCSPRMGRSGSPSTTTRHTT
jgi:adenine-specific DNA-methyltransferase